MDFFKDNLITVSKCSKWISFLQKCFKEYLCLFLAISINMYNQLLIKSKLNGLTDRQWKSDALVSICLRSRRDKHKQGVIIQETTY